jgi:hypothetical protein
MYKLRIFVTAVLLLHVSASYVLAQTKNIKRQETLRGSITRILAAPHTYQHPEEIKTFEVNRNFYIDAGKSNLVTDSL